jgi:hypothetical protein
MLVAGDSFGALRIQGRAPRKLSDTVVRLEYICKCRCRNTVTLTEQEIRKRRACGAKCSILNKPRPPACHHCGSGVTNFMGKLPSGKRRVLCRDCGKTWSIYFDEQ